MSADDVAAKLAAAKLTAAKLAATKSGARPGVDDESANSESADESIDLDDPRVVAAAQEYLAAIEAGRPLDRKAFIACHSEIAGELTQCLEGLEFVHALAVDMRKAEAAAASVPRTASSKTVPGHDPLPLGDFRLLREIGRGGMGIVYEAIQLSLDRRVAVKILPFAASLDPKHLQRFKNESQAAAQLHHTNIVPVYAVGSQRGVHFYAMQLIDGEPLSALIEQMRRLAGKSALDDGRTGGVSTLATELAAGGILPERRRTRADDRTAPFRASPFPASPFPASTPRSNAPQAATPTVAANGTSTVLAASHATRPAYFRTVALLVQQTAVALEHAHEQGIIHRDIKPANLILDQRGNIWVTDFGLAQFHADANLTRTGDMMGTLRYMSPEQAAGNRVVLDHRTDIYSLGVTLYELLTLEPLFAESERHALISRIVEDEPRAPRVLDKSIPIELETIVLKAIAKSPAERYATAQDLADDLQRFLEDKPIQARRPTLLEHAARWRRRHRAVVASAIVLLFLASLGLLGSTIVIAHEHSKTKIAYQHEAVQREAAEESFRQARQAVDGFTQLAEQELAGLPRLQPLRRKFLELTLQYYRNFIQQRAGDSDPTVRAELAATSERVERIVDELSSLQRFAPLMLLADTRVQQDLALSAADSEQVETLLIGLSADMDADTIDGERPTAAAMQHKAAELLGSTEQEITQVLTPAQLQRLNQIAWQQRGPFAFLTSEVTTALGLTTDQSEKIRAAIEQDRPRGGPHGPGGPGFGGPGFGGQGHGGPNDRRPGEPGHGPPGPPPDGFRHGLSGGNSPGESFDEMRDRPNGLQDEGGPSGDRPPRGNRGPGHPHGPGPGRGRPGQPPNRFDDDREDRAETATSSDDEGDVSVEPEAVELNDSGPRDGHGPREDFGPRRRMPPPRRHPRDGFQDGEFQHGGFQHGGHGAFDRGEFASDGGPGHSPDARWTLWQHTIGQILLVLTPEQRAKWNEMIGEPLPYDLRWRLDE